MTSKIMEWLPHLTASELDYLVRLQRGDVLWTPQSSKQWAALLSPADELYYGGAAGGGKTDLGLGLAIELHRDSIFYRREYAQLTGARGAIARSREILAGTNARYNGQEHLWRDIPGDRRLEFGGVEHEDAKQKYKGRAHDLKIFDEVPDFTESQYEFLTAWARTVYPGQRVRRLACGNPPLTPEGEWVIRRWRAWLDPQYPNPALPGELRWFATIDGREREVESGDPIQHGDEIVNPLSRTFIPAFLGDNPFLGDEYRAALQALSEPFRSQLLFGDFAIGAADDAMQIIPTEWVRLAQQRWREGGRPPGSPRAYGYDIARGGEDNTVLAKLVGKYFEVVSWSGRETKTGFEAADYLYQHVTNDAPVAMDTIGVGASAVDVVMSGVNSSAFSNATSNKIESGFRITAVPVNFAEGTELKDRSGLLDMANVRAACYWLMREALDPDTGADLAIPDDHRIRAELCAPRYKMSPRGIIVEAKDDIKKRLGFSPDFADAIVMAWYLTQTWRGPLRMV